MNKAEIFLRPTPAIGSPEALLASAGVQLDAAKTTNAALTAQLATTKAELASVRGELALAKAGHAKVTAAPVATSNAGPVAGPVPVVNGGGALTRAERDKLWEQCSTLPVAEQNAFAKRWIFSQAHA